MSKFSRYACITICGIASSLCPANAALSVIVSVDGPSSSFNHLGGDTLSVEGTAGTGYYYLDLTGDGGPTIGANFSTLDVYTQGQNLTVNSHTTNHAYYRGEWDRGGSMPGLNYIRLDLDGNTVFETVVELDFGPDSNFSDDVISRYVYETNGANLNISEAVDAFNGAVAPEPSSLFLLSCGFIGITFLRSKR